jgi:hypothetical protein|tara:strand:+ start:3586 stop:3774 length:189 start_codon:yes stop_codon:yes gene_type:complete
MQNTVIQSRRQGKTHAVAANIVASYRAANTQQVRKELARLIIDLPTGSVPRHTYAEALAALS